MGIYRYRKVDAFTSDASAGNLVACIFLDENHTPSKEAMLEIAQ